VWAVAELTVADTPLNVTVVLAAVALSGPEDRYGGASEAAARRELDIES